MSDYGTSHYNANSSKTTTALYLVVHVRRKTVPLKCIVWTKKMSIVQSLFIIGRHSRQLILLFTSTVGDTLSSVLAEIRMNHLYLLHLLVVYRQKVLVDFAPLAATTTKTSCDTINSDIIARTTSHYFSSLVYLVRCTSHDDEFGQWKKTEHVS